MKNIILLLSIFLLSCEKEQPFEMPVEVYPICTIEFSDVRIHQNNNIDIYQFRFRIGEINKLGTLSTGFPVNGKKYDYGVPDPEWGIVYRNVKPPYKGYSGVSSYTFELVNDDINIQLKPINTPSWLYMFTIKIYIDGRLERIVTSTEYEIGFYSFIKMRNNY